jgi:hypothetical protein
MELIVVTVAIIGISYLFMHELKPVFKDLGIR